MNTFFMIFAGVVVVITGKILFSEPAPRRAVSTPSPNVSGTRAAHVRPDYSLRARDTRLTITHFPLLSCSDPFDPDGAVIWRTQVPALQAVCLREPQGAPCAELQPIYVELARRYPEIYEGQTFPRWGQLLVDLGVFRVAAQTVHLTQAGRALLELLLPTTQPQHDHEVAPRWAIRLQNACRD